jgi:hypothetical protein
MEAYSSLVMANTTKPWNRFIPLFNAVDASTHSGHRPLTIAAHLRVHSVPLLVLAAQTCPVKTINNMALCALYTCRLAFVGMVDSRKSHGPLDGPNGDNLWTLYELASDTAVSARQKRVLQIGGPRFLLRDIKPEIFLVANAQYQYASQMCLQALACISFYQEWYSQTGYTRPPSVPKRRPVGLQTL